MRNHLMIMAFAAALPVCLSIPASAQDASQRSYDDGARGSVNLPQGDLSFADEVVSYVPGSGRIVEAAGDAAAMLGAPDFSGDVDDGSFTSLGCAGEAVLRFTDNALVDLDGPDLYVFEVGPNVEGMFLAISEDGDRWIEVGEITGGRAEVDIASSADAGASYRFVRLTDDDQDCGSRFAGADIDAVAAIGSAMRFVLEGEVLFVHDSAELGTRARAALGDLASEIAEAGIPAIRVVGHTDATGTARYNRALSQARADAVRDHLTGLEELDGVAIRADGRGEAEPIATNATEAGRRMNRRVEIIGM